MYYAILPFWRVLYHKVRDFQVNFLRHEQGKTRQIIQLSALFTNDYIYIIRKKNDSGLKKKLMIFGGIIRKY